MPLSSTLRSPHASFLSSLIYLLYTSSSTSMTLSTLLLLLSFASSSHAQVVGLNPTPVTGAAYARSRTKFYIQGGAVTNNGAIVSPQNQMFALDLAVSWYARQPAWIQLKQGPTQAFTTAAISNDEQRFITFRTMASNGAVSGAGSSSSSSSSSSNGGGASGNAWGRSDTQGYSGSASQGYSGSASQGYSGSSSQGYSGSSSQGTSSSSQVSSSMDLLSWRYYLQNNNWDQSSVRAQNPSKEGVTAVKDPVSGLVYLAGGYQGDDSQMYVYNFDTDSISMFPMNNVMMDRTSYAGVYLRSRKSIVYFGGSPSNGQQSQGWMTEFVPSNGAWSTLTASNQNPPHRTDFCMAANDEGTKMVVFGGKLDNGAHGKDLWILDIPSMTWSQGPSFPEARISTTCTVAGSTFIAWGGSNGIRTVDGTAVLYDLNRNQFIQEYAPPTAYTNPDYGYGSQNGGHGGQYGNRSSLDDKNKAGSIAIVGGIIGAVLLVAIAILVSVFLKKQRGEKHRASRSCGSEEGSASSTSGYHNYFGGDHSGGSQNGSTKKMEAKPSRPSTSTQNHLHSSSIRRYDSDMTITTQTKTGLTPKATAALAANASTTTSTQPRNGFLMDEEKQASSATSSASTTCSNSNSNNSNSNSTSSHPPATSLSFPQPPPMARTLPSQSVVPGTNRLPTASEMRTLDGLRELERKQEEERRRMQMQGFGGDNLA